MAKPDFPQAAKKRRISRLAVALPFLVFFAGAAEPPMPATTLRQDEILRALESNRPEWDAAPGIWMLGRWNMDEGLERLFPFPTGKGNAASRFRLLDDAFPEEKDVLETAGEDSRGVRALLEAAEMAECRLTPEYYPEFVSADNRQPDSGVYGRYLVALLRRADRAERGGDSGEAERCYRAAILCGRHLTNDKYSFTVFNIGLIFKLYGARGYAAFLERTGRRDRAGDAEGYLDKVQTYATLFRWKIDLLNMTGEFDALPAIVRIAADDSEVFWRKEALVRLSTLRFGIPDLEEKTVLRNPVFEKAADDALSAAASRDPDPSVRRFALWLVQNVRPEGYAAMEHKFMP